MFFEFEFEFVTIVFLKRFPNSLRSVLAVNVEQNNNLPTITLLLVTCKAIYCLQLYLFFSADVINVTSDTRVHIRSKDVFTRLVLHISLPAYIGYPIISVLCRYIVPFYTHAFSIFIMSFYFEICLFLLLFSYMEPFTM